MAEARRGWWMELGSQGSQMETVVERPLMASVRRRKRDRWVRMRVKRNMVGSSLVDGRWVIMRGVWKKSSRWKRNVRKVGGGGEVCMNSPSIACE